MIMGGDNAECLKMCLQNVQGADAIIYLDGRSKDNSRKVAKELGAKVIIRDHEPDNPLWNGEQRNFYLDYLKENYLGWWCLVLDADEVIDDIKKIKSFIQEANDNQLYSIHMRHFIRDLGHEDATRHKHFVPNRLFLVQEGVIYPKGEHVVLQLSRAVSHNVEVATIWHLSYLELFYLRDRYEHHQKTSNIHTPSFLNSWYRSHLFGNYPVRPVEAKDIPETILEGFKIHPDEVYFKDRGLEHKHHFDASHWKQHFHCKTALEWGCGLGPRVVAMGLCSVDAHGIELSKWAVENTIAKARVEQGDITQPFEPRMTYDLVVAYDLLEHIEEGLVPLAISNLKLSTRKYILVSIPYLGDPNLTADPTHKTFKDKDWWKQQFLDQGLVEEKVPKHFLFREQLSIWRKDG